MEKIIVYFDDADYLYQQLAPMEARSNSTAVGTAGGKIPTHWVLVACAPRMTQHISKWVSYSARESWRKKWADKVFAEVVPPLKASGAQTTCVLARGPLPELTEKLMAEHGVQRVLDARRPKFGDAMQPVVEGQPQSTEARWIVPGAVAGMGAFLVLAAD